jgi:Domain of unknown function (DUF4412)
MNKTLAIMLFTLCSAVAQAASYEGVLEYKMTTRGGPGRMKLFLGKSAMRSEVDLAPGGHSIQLVSLHYWGKEGLAYQIDETTKTYYDITSQKALPPQFEKKYEVKNLGQETVAGFKTTHVKATRGDGEDVELWLTKDIASPKEMQRAFEQGARVQGSLLQAVERAGVLGVMVKMTGVRGLAIELVSATRKSLADALFSLDGYTKRENNSEQGGPAGLKNLPPEVQEKIREQMLKARQTKE